MLGNCFQKMTKSFCTKVYQVPEKIDLRRTYKFGLDPELVKPLPYTVRQLLSLENASQHDIQKEVTARMIKSFQRFDGDTGSSEVQIAILTQKIAHSTKHYQQNKQDKHSLRGLKHMVNKRRKLANYLKRTNFPTFVQVVKALNLRFK